MTAIPLIDGTDGARLLVKPPTGSPCNGCGYCCAAEPCGIAREFIGAGLEGPCPALEHEGGRFVCGMIVRPLVYLGRAAGLDGAADAGPGEADAMIGSQIAEALGAGRGCDAEGP
ncbi:MULTISPECIES: hypothetical protein [Methylorubrum]|uniref:hypothetical protein n=1 Tax=Methylorubrum TaxID=2282523 RepID=UPI00209CE4D2|nr:MULTISPECIES: hypothetical protein [Methylorubrum]MCP1551656.1 hypothetical protein [Methylorubrum zatmanii]MCP1556584.1 hypothetical protein [Methylorubrum extorquens]MCP1581991.1 hypothetical protein [Methylorubrum extorquens]